MSRRNPLLWMMMLMYQILYNVVNGAFGLNKLIGQKLFVKIANNPQIKYTTILQR